MKEKELISKRYLFCYIIFLRSLSFGFTFAHNSQEIASPPLLSKGLSGNKITSRNPEKKIAEKESDRSATALPPLMLEKEREQKEEARREIKPHVVPKDKSPFALDAAERLISVFGNRELEKKISLHILSAYTQDVIEMIARLSHLDIVIDPDVTGLVPQLDCVNYSIGEILRFICLQNEPHLGIIKYLNTWHVMRYEKAFRMLEAQMSEDFITEIIQIRNAKFDEEFQIQMQQMWEKITVHTKEGKTGIFFDVSSRSIFVYSLESHVDEFKQFLYEIDRAVSQVRIDVVIIVTRKNYVSNMGFNWSGVYNRQSTLTAKNSRFGFAGTGASLAEFPTPDTGYSQETPFDALKNTNLLVDPLNFALNLYTDTIHDFIKIPFVFGGTDLNKRKLNMLLNAAEQEKQVKVLARPSVLSNNNETAEMLVGENIPLQTIVQDTIEGAVRNVTTTNFKETGIHIKVRPSVNIKTKSILLDIFVQNNEIAGDLGRKTRTSGSLKALENPPVIATLRTQNRVLLHSGQTTIIGGLIVNGVLKDQKSVPFIAKIPIIGWFFRGTENEQLDQEQLIFITPTLLENGGE